MTEEDRGLLIDGAADVAFFLQVLGEVVVGAPQMYAVIGLCY